MGRVRIAFVPDICLTIGNLSADNSSGYCCWSDSDRDTQVRFVGRGPKASRHNVLEAVHRFESRLEVSQLQQVHSNAVVEALPGIAGRGDALITSKSFLALSIATADCVPVLFSNGKQTVAVHAGWRGIAAGIVSKVARLIENQNHRTTAWIGPGIGPCCYEVAPEVASKVLGNRDILGIVDRSTGRPHLDLNKVVIEQLTGTGICDIRHASTCTKCNPELLYSYRGERQEPGGHNLAFIWRES